MSSSTESEFLAVGERLLGFHGETQRVSDLAKSALGFLSGPDMVEAIERLRDLTFEVKDYLRESEAKLALETSNLMKIKERLKAAGGIFADFEMVVRQLRILSLMTKIESARLADGDQSFHFLAEEVNRQSKGITARTEELCSRLEGMNRRIEFMLARLRGVEGRQGVQERTIVQNITDGLAGLIELQTLSTRSVQTISDRSQSIADRMGEVVMAMQFHDITRQRLEHVAEALSDLTDRPGAGVLENTCRIQAALLEQARTDFVSAVNGIEANLGGLAGQVKDIASEALGLADRVAGEGSFLNEKLEQDISLAAAALDEHQRVGRELGQALKEVAGALEDMASFLSKIEGMGQSIRFIALNAAIRAAHLGDLGGPLDELAKAIRQISDEAQVTVDAVIGALEEIEGQAQAWRAGPDQNEGGARADELGRLLSRLREMNDQALSVLRAMDQSNQELVSDLGRTTSGLTVHRLVETRLNESIARLRRWAEAEIANIRPEELAARDSTYQEMAARYTMDSEREVHQAVMAEDSKPSAGSSAATGPEDEDLGDNVELF
ncbi:MAG: hypothetical protein AB1641_18025 [Thermodesulfobacteriota bacterium]